MHPLFEKASSLTETIIASAIEVHRDKGPGLIESIYEWCLLKELGLHGLGCVTQRSVLIHYKGFTREEPGPPNAQVCLDSNSEDFFRFYLKRVAAK